MQPLPLPLPLPMPPLLLSQRHQPHVDPLCRLALQLQPQQRHVTSVVGGRRQRVVVLLLLGDAYSCLLLLLLDASALVVRVRRGPHTQVHAGDCACCRAVHCLHPIHRLLLRAVGVEAPRHIVGEAVADVGSLRVAPGWRRLLPCCCLRRHRGPAASPRLALLLSNAEIAAVAPGFVWCTVRSVRLKEGLDGRGGTAFRGKRAVSVGPSGVQACHGQSRD